MTTSTTCPLPLQVKLLRVLQERQFERVGGEETLSSDFRVVVATKVPLRNLVREGGFREDLFYRVHVVPVALPPLRERRGDVPLLLQAMIERHGAGSFLRGHTVDAQDARALWPGRATCVSLRTRSSGRSPLSGSGARLEAEDLLPQDGRWRSTAEVQVEVRPPPRGDARECEIEHIKVALEATGGHRSQTAELLGISRKVLWEKLRDFGIDPEESGDAS